MIPQNATFFRSVPWRCRHPTCHRIQQGNWALNDTGLEWSPDGQQMMDIHPLQSLRNLHRRSVVAGQPAIGYEPVEQKKSNQIITWTEWVNGYVLQSFEFYRIRVGGQFSIDAWRAATGRDVGPDHPMGRITFPWAATVVKKESVNAQRFSHVPGQGGCQIIRSALDPYRLLQCPGHTPLRSGTYLKITKMSFSWYR